MDRKFGLRGQSAMEYLMTYGWALLVIVIVIAVLAYIFSSVKPPEQCLFDPGFLCSGPRLIANFTNGGTTINNVLFADFKNAQPQGIIVVGVACMESRDPAPTNWYNTAPYIANMSVDYQGSFNFGAFRNATDNLDKNVRCFHTWGTPLPATPGRDFSGTVYVAYKLADENTAIPPKVISGKLQVRSQ